MLKKVINLTLFTLFFPNVIWSDEVNVGFKDLKIDSSFEVVEQNCHMGSYDPNQNWFRTSCYGISDVFFVIYFDKSKKIDQIMVEFGYIHSDFFNHFDNEGNTFYKLRLHLDKKYGYFECHYKRRQLKLFEAGNENFVVFYFNKDGNVYIEVVKEPDDPQKNKMFLTYTKPLSDHQKEEICDNSHYVNFKDF